MTMVSFSTMVKSRGTVANLNRKAVNWYIWKKCGKCGEEWMCFYGALIKKKKKCGFFCKNIGPIYLKSHE